MSSLSVSMEIDIVETANGSIYKYLSDGRTQRYKTAEKKTYEPQNALVYVPPYDWVQKNAPEKIRDMFGDNELIYESIILSYVQGKEKKSYIINSKGEKLETNEQFLQTEGPLFLALGDRNKIDLCIPVSMTPKLGHCTYDTTKYRDGEQYFREKHFGNKVVKITYKDGRIAS